MAFAPEAVSFDRGDASILGGFTEKERGNWFEFSRNNDDFDLLAHAKVLTAATVTALSRRQ
jgi:hypothetical protein